MKTTKLILAAALSLALLPAPRASAIPGITWGTPTTISANTDVSTTGSLLYAFNIGDTGVPSTVVNGVTFSSLAAPNAGNSVTVGSVTVATSGSGDPFHSTNTGTGSASAPFSTVTATYTAAYQLLLQSATADQLGGGNVFVTLGGLTNGNSYLVQFWSNESTTFANNVLFDLKTQLIAGNTATLDLANTNAAGGVGQWVTGTFTATGTTQSVTVNGGSGVPIVNGFQVRSVPEPATSGLLAIGAAGLIICGRRRKATS